MTARPYEHLSEVVPGDLRSLAAEVDPTAPGYGSHLNFDQILRRCGHAWIAFLADLGFSGGVIVPRVEVDYAAEVGLGPLVVRVGVLHVGRTSFRLELQVEQGGQRAARAEAVLVGFDYADRTPRELTAQQRALLDEHRVPAP